MFRGALDCGATKITEEMKLAAVREIAELAKADISEEVANAYAGKELAFGPDYLIPTPFDSRLVLRIAPAVAKAAAASGVAQRPITDFKAYSQTLTRFVYQTGMIMRPVFEAAKVAPLKRVIFAEGEDERVLRAVQLALEDAFAKPILIGRPAVIESRIAKAGLRIKLGQDVECVNPESDQRFRQYWETYARMMGRNGVTPEAAKAAVRRSNTLIGALALQLGDADAMLCGLVGRFDQHLDHIHNVIGTAKGAPGLATLNALMLQNGTLFIADTYVNEDPSAELLASIAMMAAEEVRRFGLPPKVAFLSHSNFGSSNRASARKMRLARDLFARMAPDVECDGEMQGDSALSEAVRRGSVMDSTLPGEANLLICPNLDSANILFNVLKMTGGHGITVGPILLGAARPVHVLNPSSTVRRVVNMMALAAAGVRRTPE
jgi:malate dehydrogenase (oxaloacetate-decarboxylating)(NADP+)